MTSPRKAPNDPALTPDDGSMSPNKPRVSKFGKLIINPITGSISLFVKTSTRDLKEAPITNATPSSTTFPLLMKSLNSFINFPPIVFINNRIHVI